MLVTMDAERREIADGAVLFEGAEIVWVGETAGLPPDIKIDLLIGTYETEIGDDTNRGDFLRANQRLQTTLTAQNANFTYTEAPQGHSWAFWRDYLPQALTTLFP